MVTPHTIISSPRSTLSSDEALYLARCYLKIARKESERNIVRVIIHDAENSLKRLKKHAEEVATVYRDLGNVLESHGYQQDAQAFYRKANDLGYVFFFFFLVLIALDSKHGHNNKALTVVLQKLNPI